MKKVISVLGLVLIVNIVFAETFKIKVQNQYGAKVEDVRLITNNVEVQLQPTSEGEISFQLVENQVAYLVAKNCDTLKIDQSKIVGKKQLELNKKFTWKDLINPMFYIKYGGLWMLLFIIFAETGLFAGFFLPGDSLLFVAGIYCGPLAEEFLKLIGMGNLNNQWLHLLVLIGLVTVAGILGNTIGYWFGRKVGPAMFNWPDKFLYKKKYLHQAQEFYDKNGGGAIVIARFLPIVRTFAPIVAGIVGMNKAKFGFYNIVGCIAWVSSMICIGYFLDQKFPTLKNHLELIIIAIVFITTAPVLWKLFFSKKPKAPVV
jgi:membrane-associated protein